MLPAWITEPREAEIFHTDKGSFKYGSRKKEGRKKDGN
jgi:hypothetical protein